jgi:hypothetical protein
MIFFEDADMGYNLYESEAEARADFERLNDQWNCTLFSPTPRAALAPHLPVELPELDGVYEATSAYNSYRAEVSCRERQLLASQARERALESEVARLREELAKK